MNTKVITIYRDKDESIKNFKIRYELLSLTMENNHHFQNETIDKVDFIIYN